jgi:hypothetical protein
VLYWEGPEFRGGEGLREWVSVVEGVGMIFDDGMGRFGDGTVVKL